MTPSSCSTFRYFNHVLRELGVSNELRSLLYHIARATKEINFSLRAKNVGYAGTSNASGESQLALDVLADCLITNELVHSELAAMIASEEKDEPQEAPAPRGEYTVAFDPLDGSSLFDANLAIGSIFAIWPGKGLIGQQGKNLEASCYCVYGPRVIMVIAVKGKGAHEFELNEIGEYVLVRENLSIKESSKYFAPGNLRATGGNQKYLALVESWIGEGRTLRYSGGMVPDLHHILSKNEGIFSYPSDNKHPHGKLRLAFECAPFSMIMKEAGGKGLTEDGTDILDIKIEEIHQRAPIFIGSSRDVENATQALK